jgi:hypothetical protein
MEQRETFADKSVDIEILNIQILNKKAKFCQSLTN